MRKVAALILIAAVTMTAAMAAVLPGWVNNWELYYPRSRYICAVGYGSSRGRADTNAFENLGAIFGADVSAYTARGSSYMDVRNNDRSLSFAAEGVQNQSSFSVDVSNLVHSNIVERWNSGNEYISLVAMDIEKASEYYLETALDYADELEYFQHVNPDDLNLGSYHSVVILPEHLELYFEYRNILNVLDPAKAASLPPVPGAPEVNALVEELSYDIGLTIDADDDEWYLVEGEVLEALTRLGVTPTDEAARYVLLEDLEFERTELPGNPLKFISYSLVIRIRDNATRKYIFTWKGSGREGQTTYANAMSRAETALNKKIRTDFFSKFSQAFNLTALYD